MKRPNFLSCLLIAFLPILALPLLVQGESVANYASADGRVSLRVVAPIDQGAPGIVPLRVSFNNDSGGDRRFWLRLIHERPRRVLASQELLVESGIGEVDVLLQAASSGYPANLHPINYHVEIDEGYGRPSVIRLSGGVQLEALAISHALAGTFNSESLRPLNIGDSYYGAHVYNFSKGAKDWRAYSPLSSIWMKREEWVALPSLVRNALEEWVIQGGLLFLVLDYEEGERGQRYQLLGLGRKHYLPRFTQSLNEELGSGLNAFERTARPGIYPLSYWLLYGVDHFGDPYIVWPERYWQRWSAFEDLAPFGTFYWPMLIVLFLYVVLVGPISFALLGSRRRYLLFVIVPLGAIVASFLVLTIFILQAGLGTRGERITSVLLKEESGKAVIDQLQLSKNGLLFESSFELNSKSMITAFAWPDEIESEPHKIGMEPGRIDMFPEVIDDALVRDAFSSRRREVLGLRQIRPSQARLAFRRSNDGDLEVYSNIDATLDWLEVVVDNKRYHARSLLPGEWRVMSDEEMLRVEYDKLRVLPWLRDSWLPRFFPGDRYLAVVNESTQFTIETIANSSWKSSTLFYGTPSFHYRAIPPAVASRKYFDKVFPRAKEGLHCPHLMSTYHCAL